MVSRGLDAPVQVVERRVALAVEAIGIDRAMGDAAEQMKASYNPKHHRIDVSRAPLLRAVMARDPAKDRWLLLLLIHHLTMDHTGLELLFGEMHAVVQGRGSELPAPVPYRNFVAQARLGVSREEHETYFRQLLGDVEGPTAPFGLLDVQGSGSSVAEGRQRLESSVSLGLRRARGSWA